MAIYTIQSNIKNHTNDDLTKYSLFLGGINSTNQVLQQYDPLITGYSRIFMVRKPLFLNENIPVQLGKFKHILEYAFTSIQNIAGDASVDEETMNGGYVGNSMVLPGVVKDSTTSFTINVYETSGSLIREVIYTWINGMSDMLTGLRHYNGIIDNEVANSQANQTAEFIYVATDNTGNKVEYASLLTNCWPKSIKSDHFNYSQGEHNVVEYGVEFACNSYQSIQVNAVAQELINRYKVLGNSLNFYSGYDHTETGSDSDLGLGSHYNIETGQIDDGPTSENTLAPTDKYGGTIRS